jgi:hypothetical protein
MSSPWLARVAIAAVCAGTAAGAGCFAEDDDMVCNPVLLPDGAQLWATIQPGSSAETGAYHITVDAEGEALELAVAWAPGVVDCDGLCYVRGERIMVELYNASATEVVVFVSLVDAPAGPSEITMTVAADGLVGSALVRPVYGDNEGACGINMRSRESFPLQLVAE